MCIRDRLNTVNNTKTEVLANSAHPDPQCIHTSDSISKEFPGLDLVASFSLVITSYYIAVAGRKLFHTMLQTFQLVLVDARVWMLWRNHIPIQRDGLALSHILPPDILRDSVTIIERRILRAQ